MVALAGDNSPGSVAPQLPGHSIDLDGHSWSIGQPAVRAMVLWGGRAFFGPSAEPQILEPGEYEESFGGRLFERIIVIPRVQDCGFVITDVTWTTEVWNTHRREDRPLSGIGLDGSGGLVLVGPTSYTFLPFASVMYTATIPGDGTPVIRETATWTFTGESGADMLVLGTRVMLFPFRPDWSEPWRETISYYTEILSSYDESEQRRALRQSPRFAATFRVLTTTPLESAALECLLAGWQTKLFGVPWWPETSLLLADVLPGADSLTLDLSGRPSFVEGGLVMVWASFSSWEVFRVAAVGFSSITVAFGVTKEWKAGARIVPVRRGYLPASQDLARPANWIQAGVFTFSCESM